jgi:tRNA threonylcarbamoyl adenosine modification protein YeaZ
MTSCASSNSGKGRQLFLAWDCAFSVGTVALLQKKQRSDQMGWDLLAQLAFQTKAQGTEKLLACIVALLTAHDLSMEQITGLIIGQGPGSYTGLRLACTTANTLKLVFPELLLAGVNSLGLISSFAKTWIASLPIIVLQNAYQGDVYVHTATQNWLMTPEKLIAQLWATAIGKETPGVVVHFLPQGVADLTHLLDKFCQNGWTLLSGQDILGSGLGLGFLATIQGQLLEFCESLEPDYAKAFEKRG